MRRPLLVTALGLVIVFCAERRGDACSFYGGCSPAALCCRPVYPWFYLGGTPLGLGPGFPGLIRPWPRYHPFGFYPEVGYAQPWFPAVTSFVMSPFPQSPAASNGGAAAPASPERSPANNILPPGAASGIRPGPPSPSELGETSWESGYIARRYYRGKSYPLSPEEIDGQDFGPGIVLWSPGN